jgi:hypothetical protein
MYQTNAGLWPMVAAPASEARTLAHRIAIAQAKAAPDPHRADGAERLTERMLEAFRGRAAGAGRAAA